MKAVLAEKGATLPGELRIQASTLRGVQSQGMLCSRRELGLGEDAEGIMELPADAPVGEDLRDYLSLEDQVIDIDLTPNRGDCFSMLGIARELAASLEQPLTTPAADPVPAVAADEVSVHLSAPEGCPRFVGRVIRGLAAGARSPVWLVERLRRAGVRSIHPVVDVTNYVMLEFGQPLHGYDLAKLQDRIDVRWSRPGEKLTLLDGNEVELRDTMLVIADGPRAVALAGIMGGLSTAVDDNTQDVFLEAAFFAVDAIAGRARQLGLHTDASLRFERGVDPQQQARAVERATRLLLDIAGGEPGPLVEAVSEPHLPPAAPVPLRARRLEQLLGLPVAGPQVENLLGRLGMTMVSDGPERWQVTPPSFRFDIRIEEDLVEEVARLVGYDAIPRTPAPTAASLASCTEQAVPEDELVDILVARGYQEAITYSFIHEKLQRLLFPDVTPVRLANPISQDMGVMRHSLWPGLLTAARANLHRQAQRQRLFELGCQFEKGDEGVTETPILAGIATGSRWPERWWDNERAAVDFYDVKADLEALVARTGRSEDVNWVRAEHPALHPGQSAQLRLNDHSAGWLGALHPVLGTKLEMNQPAILFALSLDVLLAARLPRYLRLSKFPALRRDLAVVVDEDVDAATVVAYARQAAGSALSDIIVFDVYRGQGIDSSRKSIALGLILQETSRTLTDHDAEGTVGSVVERLTKKLGATIRN
jgi:phenylalanyl-tRNA synthetase beta chain